MSVDELYQAFLVVTDAFEDVLLALTTEKRRTHGWERGDIAIIRELVKETKLRYERTKPGDNQPGRGNGNTGDAL